MKMNISLIWGAIGTLFIAMQAGANPILSSTGLGLQGTVDPNYTLVDAGSTGIPPQVPLIQYDSGVYGNLIGSDWQVIPGAQWISPWVPGTSTDPWVTDNQGYSYDFRTIVGGSGSALVSGIWSSDDNATMYVNGIAVASRGSWPTGLAYFSTELTAGETVDFVVENEDIGSGAFGNPAGLDLAVTSVPDSGTTTVLLGCALVGLQGLRRKMAR